MMTFNGGYDLAEMAQRYWYLTNGPMRDWFFKAAAVLFVFAILAWRSGGDD